MGCGLGEYLTVNGTKSSTSTIDTLLEMKVIPLNSCGLSYHSQDDIEWFVYFYFSSHATEVHDQVLGAILSGTRAT